MLVHRPRMFAAAAFVVAAVACCCTSAVAADVDVASGFVGHCYVPRRMEDCGHYACNASSDMCVRCHQDADCYFGSMHCNKADGKCANTHMYDRSPLKLVGAFFTGIGICTIGVLAGVGGGGAMTPAYAGILDMPLKYAVIASLASIFGQGLLNVPYLMPQRYPTGSRRPLINYPVLALWYPITAAGTLIGAHWRNAVPNWFRNIMLIVVSLIVSVRVVYHAWHARQKERKANMIDAHREANSSYGALAGGDGEGAGESPDPNCSQAATDVSAPSGMNPDASPSSYQKAHAPLMANQGAATNATTSGDATPVAGIHGGVQQQDTSATFTRRSSTHQHHHRNSARRGSVFSVDEDGVLLNITDDDASSCTSDEDDDESVTGVKQLPQYPVHYVVSLLLIVGVVTISKYGSRSSTCGGSIYWLSLAMGGLALAIIFIFWRWYVWYTRRRVLKGELPRHHEQIENTVQATFIFPMMSMVAGFCSSTVGIGGGTLINPLLIESGLIPEEASATGGMFTFLIALESTLSAAIDGSSGTISLVWVAFFCFVGFLSTVAGRLVLLPFFKRRGATSVIVAALALSLILTFVAVGAYGGVSFGQMIKYGVPFSFTALCPKDHTDITTPKPAHG